MFLPKLGSLPQTMQTISVFRGLNDHDPAPEGQWADELNMTSDHFPLAATRAPRRRVLQNDSRSGIYGMTGGENLVWFKSFEENGEVVTDLFRGEENLTAFSRKKGFLSFAPGKKTICRMGGNFFIHPDNILIEGQKREDILEGGDYVYNGGKPFYLGYPVTAAAAAKPVSQNCYQFRVEPTEPMTASKTPPEDTGKLWYDMGERIVRRYSQAENKWLEYPDTRVRLTLSYSGAYDHYFQDVALKAGDSVEFVYERGGGAKSLLLQFNNESGSFADDGLFENLWGVHTLLLADNEQGIYEFAGLLTGSVDGSIDTTHNEREMVTLRREPPLMDALVECKNRIWGCRYGKNRAGKPVNEVYACALGDPKNWFQYQGLSTDSYAASVGTGAQFTGAVNYDGHPMFFKSDRFYTVYISSGGAHQLIETVAPGVQPGSGDSLVLVDSALYYLGNDGVYRYTGSQPAKISENLRKLSNTVGIGGENRRKYYLQTDQDMFVYDTVRGIWHRESSASALAFAATGEGLFFLDQAMALWTVSAGDGQTEGSFPWFLESGMLGYADGRQKRIARIAIRAQTTEGMKVSISYDDSGVWEDVKEISKAAVGSTLVNIRPRRCDHFRYRISGTGDCKIFAISKYYEKGSIRP